MRWRELVLLVALVVAGCSRSTTNQAAQPSLPVVAVDAVHSQLGQATAGASVAKYVVAPGPGLLVDASGYTLAAPRNAPAGVQAPNCIQVIRGKDAIYNVVWTEPTKRYAVTSSTATAVYGSGPFTPLIAGETVIIGIGHLRPAAKGESSEAFVPFWVGLADVRVGS